jgi:hypothetical protein
VLSEAARGAFATGDLASSRSLYARAIASARAARINEIAGSFIAEQAMSDALVGDAAQARDELQQAVGSSAGPDTTWPASIAAAFLGRAPQAHELAQAYERVEPPAPDVVAAQTPMLQAAIALANKDGRGALTILNGASPYDRTAGPWLQYLRGLAYLAVHEYPAAAEQFRTIIGRPGLHPVSLLHTLARLELARAAAGNGDATQARQSYADFTLRWHSADARHPLNAAAAAEAAALPTPPATSR